MSVWKVRWTSFEAFLSLLPTMDTIDGRIAREIREAGGLTCEEVEQRLSMHHQTASGAIWRLCKDGVAHASRETRINSTGKNAIVWKIGRA